MESLLQFDNNMSIEPSSHSYLGCGLETLPCSLHDGIHPTDHNEYHVILLHYPGVIIFPSETIPLRIPKSVYDNIKNITKSKPNLNLSSTYLGIVNKKNTRSKELLKIGTLVRIRARVHDYSNNPNTPDIPTTAEGISRFEINYSYQELGSIVGCVRILPECMGRTKSMKVNQFPDWVYQVYDTKRLARKSWELLKQSAAYISVDSADSGSSDSHTQSWQRWGPAYATTTATATVCIDDPETDNRNDAPLTPPPSATSQGLPAVVLGAELNIIEFSYYLAANLPSTDNDRLKLLKADDAMCRLLLAIKLMQKGLGKPLGCASCSAELAPKQSVFQLPGAEGVVGAYVNVHGHVHQTVTIRDVLPTALIILHGTPTTQDSWFPGYAWTIANCAHCYNHLGWLFTKTNGVNIMTTAAAGTSAASATVGLLRLMDQHRMARLFSPRLEFVTTVNSTSNNTIDTDNNNRTSNNNNNSGNNSNTDVNDDGSYNNHIRQTAPPDHFWGLRRTSLNDVSLPRSTTATMTALSTRRHSIATATATALDDADVSDTAGDHMSATITATVSVTLDEGRAEESDDDDDDDDENRNDGEDYDDDDDDDNEDYNDDDDDDDEGYDDEDNSDDYDTGNDDQSNDEEDEEDGAVIAPTM